LADGVSIKPHKPANIGPARHRARGIGLGKRTAAIPHQAANKH
jgi:hypothetical protein